jgi:hypothetical protein
MEIELIHAQGRMVGLKIVREIKNDGHARIGGDAWIYDESWIKVIF